MSSVGALLSRSRWGTNSSFVILFNDKCSSSLLIFLLQNLFSHGLWKEIELFHSDPLLRDAAKEISTLVLASKADNTNKKYKLYFEKFSRWCSLHKLSALPARSTTVCIYISSLFKQRISSSVLDAAV